MLKKLINGSRSEQDCSRGHLDGMQGFLGAEAAALLAADLPPGNDVGCDQHAQTRGPEIEVKMRPRALRDRGVTVEALPRAPASVGELLGRHAARRENGLAVANPRIEPPAAIEEAPLVLQPRHQRGARSRRERIEVR